MGGRYYKSTRIGYKKKKQKTKNKERKAKSIVRKQFIYTL